MTTDARGIDADALRAKYCAERDKRLRADGNDQDRELKVRSPARAWREAGGLAGLELR